MSWYKTPIQPIDPVVVSQQPKPPIRYIRDNFTGTGQDSHTLPPSQAQDQWQALTNVMPITKGVLEPRWGYGNLFAGGTIDPLSRLYTFQSDSSGTRAILDCAPNRISSYNETGTLTNFNIFTPTSGKVVRAVSSRNFQYFCDGSQPDNQKWDGTDTTTTNWGIDGTDVTANQSGGGTSSNTYGPDRCTTITDGGGAHPWTNFTTLSGPSATAKVTLSGSDAAASDRLTLTHAGFSVPGGTIAGISINIQGSITGVYSSASIHVSTAKGGNAYGTLKNSSIGGGFNITFGSSTDLWAGSWVLGDINSTGFGCQIYGNASPVDRRGVTTMSAQINLTSVQITVYTTTGASSSTSGSGVGISSIVGSGAVTLAVGRIYYMTFYNTDTGHFSDLTPPSPSTGPTSSAKINLLLATCNDPQVTHKYLLATADGNDPAILYLVAELTNGGAGDAKTYQDNTPDTTLILNQTFLFTDQSGNEFGVTQNSPPPGGGLTIKHQGRMWMAGVPGATHSVFFSKSVGELTLPNGFIAGKYEEAFPGSNYFDVSDGAESVAGFLSDGVNLYIGTQNHIRRLIGNDANNFAQPEIVHPHVGLINQEVWQLVFNQGSPAGAIWLTPDFRVMQSDFNTYIDIGSPVQDILNKVQNTAPTVAHAMFVSDGEYELYILGIPVNTPTVADVHLVFDLRQRQWYVWSPQNGASGSYAMLFNITVQGDPQWLWLDSLSNVFQYSPNFTADNGTPIVVTATTSWLHLGEPANRKVLNEVQVIGDPTQVVTVRGANRNDQFTTPDVVVNNLALRQSPFQTWTAYLTGYQSRHKYFQFTFSLPGGGVFGTTFLGGFSIASHGLGDV